MKIFKAVKLKKKNLYECYDNIVNVIGYDKMEDARCIPYQYLIYFLDLYPMEFKIKKKILLHAAFFTVYW